MKLFQLASALIMLVVCRSQQDLAMDMAKRSSSKRSFWMNGPCIWTICNKPLIYEQEKTNTIENGKQILKQITEKLASKKRKMLDKKKSIDIQNLFKEINKIKENVLWTKYPSLAKKRIKNL